jgi:hypothetical protein
MDHGGVGTDSLQNMDPILNKISKQEFNNTSKYDFP